MICIFLVTDVNFTSKCKIIMFELIAEAASSINVFSMARRIAAFNVPVLIHGETGTGKEL